jgi:hypothetical protein
MSAEEVAKWKQKCAELKGYISRKNTELKKKIIEVSNLKDE